MTQAWFNHGARIGRLDEIGDRHCVFHDYGEWPRLRPEQVPATAMIGRRARARVIETSFPEAEVALLAEGWTPRQLRVRAPSPDV